MSRIMSDLLLLLRFQNCTFRVTCWKSSLYKYASTDLTQPNNVLSTTRRKLTTIFIDGSSVNTTHGRVGGAGIFWGEDDPRNVAQPLLTVFDDQGGEKEVTNNGAELMAALIAVRNARDQGLCQVMIKTDSTLVTKAMNEWIEIWMAKEWKTMTGTDVKNKRLFLCLWVTCRQLGDVRWRHVSGHSGIKGNEEAHRLATEGAKLAQQMIKEKYSEDIDEVVDVEESDDLDISPTFSRDVDLLANSRTPRRLVVKT